MAALKQSKKRKRKEEEKTFQSAHEWRITVNQVASLLPCFVIGIKRVITSEAAAEFHFVKEIQFGLMMCTIFLWVSAPLTHPFTLAASLRTMRSTCIIYEKVRLCLESAVCADMHVCISLCESGAIQMRGGYVLQAQVYACVISSLCMQILIEDGHGEGERGWKTGGGWSEKGRGKRRKMVWWQSCRHCVCTCISRQINHEMVSYSIKMLIQENLDISIYLQYIPAMLNVGWVLDAQLIWCQI